MSEATAPRIKCTRCGRRLSNARSTARALGPVCARKTNAAQAEAATPAPAVVAIAAGKVRESAQVPGLTYETALRDGVVFVTFRYGAAFECVAVSRGQAVAVDCSDRYSIPPHAAAVCRTFVQQLAAGLADKVVA